MFFVQSIVECFVLHFGSGHLLGAPYAMAAKGMFALRPLPVALPCGDLEILVIVTTGLYCDCGGPMIQHKNMTVKPLSYVQILLDDICRSHDLPRAEVVLVWQGLILRNMEMLAPYILISNVMQVVRRLPESEAICNTEKVLDVIQCWGCGKGKGQGKGESKGKGKNQNQGQFPGQSCSCERCPLRSEAKGKGKGQGEGASVGSRKRLRGSSSE